jgi:hypothetical protein
MEILMKNAMRRLWLAVAMVASMVASTTSAEAGFTYQTIHGEYLFPSTTNDYLDLGTQVVNPTATFNDAGINEVTVYDTSMILSTLVPTDGKTMAAFNGFGLIDTSGNIGVSSFIVDPTTNVPGFVASDVTVLSDRVLINIEGLTLTSSEVIKLDFTFNPSSVPEPSSLALCGIAGGIALVVSWCRRSRAASS